MRKILFLVLILNTIVFASGYKKLWTLNVATVSSVKEAESFIAQSIVAPKGNIYIVKHYDRYKVIYGAFSTYLEASSFLKKYGSSVKNIKPYILGYKYNLINVKQIPTLVKFYKYSSQNDNVLVYDISNMRQIQQQMKTKAEQPESSSSFVNVKFQKKEYLKVGLGVEYTPLTLDGDIKIVSGDTKAKFKDDLGVEDSEASLATSIWLEVYNHRFFISYLSNSYENEYALTKNITLNNYTYSSGAKLTTTVDTTAVNSGYKYKASFATIGFVIDYFKHEVGFDSNTNNIKLESDYYLYGATIEKEHNYGDFSIDYGLGIGLGGDATYINYYAGAGVKFDMFDIDLGYKVRDLSIDGDKFESKLNYSGVYFSLSTIF